jgi:hypothetical protein
MASPELPSEISAALGEDAVRALCKVASPPEVKRCFEQSKPKALPQVYKVVMEDLIAKASEYKADAHGRGAIFTIEKALKALLYEAHIREQRVIMPDVWKGAEQRLGTVAQESLPELRKLILSDALPIFSILDRRLEETPILEVVHPSFQEYYVACAIRDMSWKLPILPWQASGFWARVLEIGGRMGNSFWRGLAQATPYLSDDAKMKAINIRNVVGGHRATSLMALGGFIVQEASHVASLDWSSLRLDESQAESLFKAFGRDTLPRLARLHLNDNMIGERGGRAMCTALNAGAMMKLEELQLSNNRLGNGGIRALATSVARGALTQLKQIFLNSNQIGDDGIVALAEAVQPTASRPDGALAKCEVLTLAYNQIDRAGVEAMAAACAQGALPSMSRFLIACNPCPNPALIAQALVGARKPRKRSVVPLYVWPEEQGACDQQA